jgi:RNA polymerase sigma factor (sigma-70 family)
MQYMSKPVNTRQTLLFKIRDQYDDSAWDDFVKFYRPYIYRVIQNLNVTACDREDIIQDIMLIAWKKLPEFEYDPAKGRFRSWLCTVAQRTAIQFRDKKNRREFFEDPVFNDELKKGSSCEVEDLSKREWERHIADMAWKNIESKFDANVIETFKRLASGEKGEEVAKDLELSQNSVYVYKKRVLAALQKEIAFLDAELS